MSRSVVLAHGAIEFTCGVLFFIEPTLFLQNTASQTLTMVRCFATAIASLGLLSLFLGFHWPHIQPAILRRGCVYACALYHAGVFLCILMDPRFAPGPEMPSMHTYGGSMEMKRWAGMALHAGFALSFLLASDRPGLSASKKRG